MLTRSKFPARLGAVLFIAALAGCAEAPDTSGAQTRPDAVQSPEDSPTADFDTAELKRFNAGLRSPSCEQAAACARGSRGEASEACSAAAQACLKDVSTRSQGVLASVETCRESAAECSKAGAPRQECAKEFKACTKGALEDASRQGESTR